MKEKFKRVSSLKINPLHNMLTEPNHIQSDQCSHDFITHTGLSPHCERRLCYWRDLKQPNPRVSHLSFR